MKSLLIAVGLALCCLVQANQDKRPGDTDLSKIHGNWVVGAMVTSCQMMKEMLPRMPASPISFEQQSENEMKMTMEMATPNGCKTMRPVLKGENGVLTTTCGRGGKKTVEYINMSGNSMFSLITLSHQKGQCKTATLAGRDLSDIQGSLEKFRDFANRHGLEGEKIYVLSEQEMCPRSS